MRPQLCEGHAVEDDGPALGLHAARGHPLPRQRTHPRRLAVASIAGWSARDTLGQHSIDAAYRRGLTVVQKGMTRRSTQPPRLTSRRGWHRPGRRRSGRQAIMA
jgi:hypothetical protein